MRPSRLTSRGLAIALAWLVLVLVGCSDDRTERVRRPTPSSTVPDANADTAPTDDVRFEEVARVPRPTAVASLPVPDRYVVASQTGQVWLVDAGPAGSGTSTPELLVDLSSEVTVGSGEQGLLGLAANADGTALFVDYTTPTRSVHVDRIEVAMGPPRVGARTTLLEADIPEANDLGGGSLEIAPDGSLLVGFLDSRITRPEGSGWARIDRIDPTSGALLGTISGLRAPWQFAIDPDTGDLWIGDSAGPLGEQEREERVTVVTTDDLRAIEPGAEPDLPPTPADIDASEGTVFTYSERSGGCALTAGVVYRGGLLPTMDGSYVFADYCLGLMSLDADAPTTAKRRGRRMEGIVSIDVDRAGNMLLANFDGVIYRLQDR